MDKIKSVWLKYAVWASVGLSFALASWAFARSFGNQMIENEFIKKLKTRLETYQKERPSERAYLHFDKPFYKPGETIWFAAYLRNETDLKPSETSQILHVELLDPRGGKVKEYALVTQNGVARGDFTLDAEAAGGLYKVKAYTRWQENDENGVLFEKELQVQAVALPRLLMKLDFERKAFGPGETVIAKIDLRSLENKPLSNLSFKYVASLAGASFLTKNGTTDGEGRAFIRFELPKDLKTSDGLLNVLISHAGENESISRAIPIVLNKINLSLYPEGGDLISGMEGRVAFAAVNEHGKPADVGGLVVDNVGNIVARFESFHQGMGAFKLKPENGKKYKVKLLQPAVAEYELPEALPRGYGLKVEKDAMRSVKVTVFSTEAETLSLVAQTRGHVYYASAITCKPGENLVEIRTDDFPIGTAQFTLFDAKGIERAERLCFVNNDKQLKIAVKTDKEKYQPREKVELTLQVTDERGVPVPGNFSLSVVDDKLLSFADDKTGNILSQLLFEQDIKGKVEEAKFYFDPKEPKAEAALDYLLMTRGWRRFTWKKIENGEYYAVKHPAEKNYIYGLTMDGFTQKPVSNIPIQVMQNNKVLRNITSDEKGAYKVDKIDLGQGPIALKIDIPSQDLVKRFPTSEKYYKDMGYKTPPPYTGLFTQTNYGEFPLTIGAQELYATAMEMDMVEAVGGGGRDRNREMKAERNVPRMAMAQRPMAPAGALNEPMRGGPEPPIKAVPVRNKADADAAKPVPAPALEMANFENKADAEKAKREEPQQFVEDKRMRRMQADAPALKKRANPNAGIAANDDFGDDDMGAPAPSVPAVTYYRAREFASPTYSGPAETRTDFRGTIFWKGDITLDRSGKTTLSFYNSDEVTAFRITVEGISDDGTPGHGEHVYYTQLPFSMSVKPPVEVAMGDKVLLPLVLVNNTPQALTGTLEIKAPKAWKPVGFVGNSINLAPNDAKTLYLEYEVLNQPGSDMFTVAFQSKWAQDAFEQEIKTAPRGFPSRYAFSGSEAEKTFEVNINDLVPGTLEATLTAYPSALSEMIKGLESMLREPSGCFEQTSSTAYPNVMVMQYLKENDVKDPALLAKADKLLASGYKKLTAYETKQKGYEWFGGVPAHEALTAYGLLEFKDMESVFGSVDKGMMDRTAAWLMTRKDGKGGFMRDPKALDSFGGASPEITNAYIVYALAEAGYTDIQKEIDVAYKAAVSSGDPYQLALVANALFMIKDKKRGDELLGLLSKKQQNDGGWNGATHSITRSGGIGLKLEATSLAILALLKNPSAYGKNLNDGIKFLSNNRTNFGGYGSTQSTILALKALTAYTKYSKRTAESGEIEFYIDGKKVASKKYEAGNEDPISIADLGAHFSAGKHTLKVKYAAGVKNPMPFALSVGWSTYKPVSSPECKVKLDTKLANPKAKVGETARLTTRLTNVSAEGLPMTLAVVGIPGGFSPQPWQLKELQEKNTFDFYEVIGSNVVFYYRQMKPNETREIALDLKAELPGEYEAPASSAYLYYTNEYKFWTAAEKATIQKP